MPNWKILEKYLSVWSRITRSVQPCRYVVRTGPSSVGLWAAHTSCSLKRAHPYQPPTGPITCRAPPLCAHVRQRRASNSSPVRHSASVSRWGPVMDSCEHGNEPAGPIKCGKLPDLTSASCTKFRQYAPMFGSKNYCICQHLNPLTFRMKYTQETFVGNSIFFPCFKFLRILTT
jgi:hypothetical protein